MGTKRDRAMTLEALYQQLGSLTPEQRANKAMCVGDDKGWYLETVEVLADDQVNPSGDGMEPRMEWMKEAVAHEDYTQEEAEAEPIVVPKGHPLLVIVE